MARPRKEVNLNEKDLVKQLFLIHCTMEEVEQITGLSERTLRRRYAGIIKSARASGKSALRKAMWKNALEKLDGPMQRFLAANLLGMSIQRSPDAPPPPVEGETTFKIGWADENDQPNNAQTDQAAKIDQPISEPVQPGDLGPTIGKDDVRD